MSEPTVPAVSDLASGRQDRDAPTNPTCGCREALRDALTFLALVDDDGELDWVRKKARAALRACCEEKNDE